MKKNTAALAPDTYYHIFNRGINKEILFKEKRNYTYFLNKYLKFISPIAKTYAFCLLKNHFHFLICTRSEETLKKFKLYARELTDAGKKLREFQTQQSELVKTNIENESTNKED